MLDCRDIVESMEDMKKDQMAGRALWAGADKDWGIGTGNHNSIWSES